MSTLTRLWSRIDGYTLWAFNPDHALDPRRARR